MVGVPRAAVSSPVRNRGSQSGVGLSMSPGPADAGDERPELVPPKATVDRTAVNMASPAPGFADEAPAAGLVVLAGWRERVALRVVADGEGSGGADPGGHGGEAVRTACEVVAGWAAEAGSGSLSPVVASERVRGLAMEPDGVTPSRTPEGAPIWRVAWRPIAPVRAVE